MGLGFAHSLRVNIVTLLAQRFIDGCLGDMTEAARRWRITVEWRRQYGTDAILEQPHPYFKLIKEVRALVGVGDGGWGSGIDLAG